MTAFVAGSRTGDFALNRNRLLTDKGAGRDLTRLRSYMRIELAKLHRQLKATMIYVTHDQLPGSVGIRPDAPVATGINAADCHLFDEAGIAFERRVELTEIDMNVINPTAA